MKIKSCLEKGTNNMHRIPISKERGEAIIEKFGKRVVCLVNGIKIHCSIQRSKEFGFYIIVGKTTREKIKATYKDDLELEIQKDTSKYKSKLPTELSEVLRSDPEANRYFKLLTDGKKRSIIHVIEKAKQEETRINRSLKIAEKLKGGITNLKDLIR